MIQDNRTFCVSFIPDCPWTTGHLILKAFRKLGLKVVFAHPHDAASVVADKYLFVDSAHCYQINTPKEKTAIYSIDCYQNGLELFKQGFDTRLGWWMDVANHVSIVFDAFEYGYHWWRKMDKKVIFIAMGCDEEIFYKENLDKKYDVCFVGGRKTQGIRREILKIVEENFNLHSPHTYFDGIRTAAAQSRCFLDISPMEEDMLGQRFFEGYACETPMVSMERPTLLAYNSPKAGIYTYDLFDLEKSLISSVNAAMKHSEPIVRDIETMKWTAKVEKILKYI